MLEGDERIEWLGGEARFCKRPRGDGVACIGEDMLFEGWRARERHYLAAMDFDSTGWPLDDAGAEMQRSHVDSLAPALQLQCRARMEIDDMVDAPWVTELGLNVKRAFTHIALDVQRTNKANLARLQAQCRFTVAYTGDASQKVCKRDGRLEEDDYGR